MAELESLGGKAVFQFMNPEYIYERRQSAGHLEAVMLVASIAGTITAVLVVFTYGAYALSRVFDWLGDLLASTEPGEQRIEQIRPVKDKNDA